MSGTTKVKLKDTLKAIEQLEFSDTAGESVKEFVHSEYLYIYA